MHLRELLRERPRPAAGVFLALTRRCPLHCAHCSTSSTLAAEQAPASLFQRFVDTFTAADHPDFLLLTGGEPLLRPSLVTQLAGAAARVGCRSYLLTGAFFARTDRPSHAVGAALRSVHHVAISLDVFHQAEVPRPLVFRAAHRLRAAGTAVSFQVVGTGDEDPALVDTISAIRAEFADQVPVLVGRLEPVGRARGWLVEPLDRPAEPAGPDLPGPVQPCTSAAWPVVGFDGTVTACANQAVVDHAPLPAHLVLGHADRDTWPAIRERCQRTPLIEAIRTVGPRYLATRAHPGGTATGYCQSCWRLSDRSAGAGPRAGADRATSPLLAAAVRRAQLDAGAVGFARRHGSARHADLVTLGWPDAPAGSAPLGTDRPCPG